jgi:hypothetical protein
LPNLLQNNSGVFTVLVTVEVGDVVGVVVTVVVVVVVVDAVVVEDVTDVVVVVEVTVVVVLVMLDVVLDIVVVVLVSEVVVLVIVVVVVLDVGVVVGEVVGVVISQPANVPSSKRDCTAALIASTAALHSELVCTAIAFPSCNPRLYPWTGEFSVYSSIIFCNKVTALLSSVLSTSTLVAVSHSTAGASPLSDRA